MVYLRIPEIKANNRLQIFANLKAFLSFKNIFSYNCVFGKEEKKSGVLEMAASDINLNFVDDFLTSFKTL